MEEMVKDLVYTLLCKIKNKDVFMVNDSIMYNSEHKPNKTLQKIELNKACPLSNHEKEVSG